MNIEIPIGKSRYKINCEEGQKEKLLRLAERLNKRVNSLSLEMKNVDEKTLLAISALMIEEELENKKGTREDEPEINDEDIYPEQNQEISEYKENMENIENKNIENKNIENKNIDNKNIDDIIEVFNKIGIKPKRNVKFDETKSIIN